MSLVAKCRESFIEEKKLIKNQTPKIKEFVAGNIPIETLFKFVKGSGGIKDMSSSTFRLLVQFEQGFCYELKSLIRDDCHSTKNEDEKRREVFTVPNLSVLIDKGYILGYDDGKVETTEISHRECLSDSVVEQLQLSFGYRLHYLTRRLLQATLTKTQTNALCDFIEKAADQTMNLQMRITKNTGRRNLTEDELNWISKTSLKIRESLYDVHFKLYDCDAAGLLKYLAGEVDKKFPPPYASRELSLEEEKKDGETEMEDEIHIENTNDVYNEEDNNTDSSVGVQQKNTSFNDHLDDLVADSNQNSSVSKNSSDHHDSSQSSSSSLDHSFSSASSDHSSSSSSDGHHSSSSSSSDGHHSSSSSSSDRSSSSSLTEQLKAKQQQEEKMAEDQQKKQIDKNIDETIKNFEFINSSIEDVIADEVFKEKFIEKCDLIILDPDASWDATVITPIVVGLAGFLNKTGTMIVELVSVLLNFSPVIIFKFL